MKRVLLCACLIVLMASSLVYAGTRGNLEGKITDAESGNPLQGANVFLQDTNYGSPSGEDGTYEIYNIPAGTYTAVVSFIGYQRAIVEEVVIVPDYTRELNISIQPSALEMEEIIVSGERYMLKKDETATVRVTKGEDVQNMPVQNYADVVGLQASVVQDRTKSIGSSGRGRASATDRDQSSGLYIRGGRSNEVDFLVDGFSQKNPISGGVTTSVNKNAIEQIVVTTGGFNAEYGRIMSGVVNVTTKGGAKRWSGSAEVVTDAVSGDWINTTKFGQNLYSASLGGPLFSEKYRIYMSGEFRDMEDREPHHYVETPFYGTIDDTGEIVRHYEDGQLPHNDLEGWSLQGKMNFDLTSALKFELGGLGSEDQYNTYFHSYKYNMDHAPYTETANMSFYGKVTHMLDSKTFYDVSANYFFTEYFRGDGIHRRDLRDYGRESNPRHGDFYYLFWNADDPTTTIERDSLGNIKNDEGHVYDDFLWNESSYWGAKFNMTTQRIDDHEIKFGFDYQQHTLRRYHHLFPSQIFVEAIDSMGVYDWNDLAFQDVDAYGFEVDKEALDEGRVELVDLDDGWNAAKNPVTWSAYIQDKITYQNMVLNVGLRYDYLDPETKRLKDENSPLGEDGTSLDDEDLEDSKPYHKLSPRLGLSFPVSDKMFFHVSYGKFFQQPNLQDLYVDYDYLAYKVRTGGYFFPFGNPNLNPEETTAYEVGIARQIGDNLRFDIKAYYKDVTGLVQVVNQPTDIMAFSSYRNQDFATIKGFDFTLKMRRTNHLAMDIGYTLAFAKGTGSLSAEHQNIAWQASEDVVPPKQTSPLAFDQRHKVSINMDYRYQNNEGPELMGMQPFENAGINIVLNAGSGLPYTPMEVYNEATLAAVTANPTGPINSSNMPWTYYIDTKLSKGFKILNGEISMYLWIKNLLNTRNPVRVYESTGTAETTTWLYTENGQNFLEENGERAEILIRDKENDPLFYNNPRIVRLGVSYSF